VFWSWVDRDDKYPLNGTITLLAAVSALMWQPGLGGGRCRRSRIGETSFSAFSGERSRPILVLIALRAGQIDRGGNVDLAVLMIC
jgi:hypothetical protein